MLLLSVIIHMFNILVHFVSDLSDVVLLLLFIDLSDVDGVLLMHD